MTTSATITIPANYLEDARNGALTEIADDTQALRNALTQDRESSALMLQRSSSLLGPLLKATGDTELTAERDNVSSPLVHMLEAMIRSLLPRLSDAAQFAPIPMADVADLAAEVRWAAEEAMRIDPGMATRLTSDDRKVA
jgi:hypothetical protein